MRELLKNKLMIGFLVFVVGFTYVSSMKQQKMEENHVKAERDYVVMNVR